MVEEICGRFIAFFRGIDRNDFRCNVSLIIPKQRNKFTTSFVFRFLRDCDRGIYVWLNFSSLWTISHTRVKHIQISESLLILNIVSAFKARYNLRKTEKIN
jgi:hypothetical protein